MTISESIIARKSIRSYTGNSLKKEDIQAINRFISEQEQVLGGCARVMLIHSSTGVSPVKLGTYGVISQASDFLVLVYKPGDLAEQNAGYLFEQVVLFCTTLGLGTCWLGGTFKKSDFVKQLQLQEDEVLRIVSPVGYPAEKVTWLDQLMRKGAGSRSRKPFETLFFNHNFETSLNSNDAGKYAHVLKMVRLAPSASNSQPWRVVKEGNRFHFYDSIAARFSSIDLGIALCHFGEACKEAGISGRFETLNPGTASKNNHYVISWVE